jgi:hypothetical protein
VQIGPLHALEAEWRRLDAITRAQQRGRRPTLVLAELNPAFHLAVADPAIHSSTLLDKAVRYALVRWAV